MIGFLTSTYWRAGVAVAVVALFALMGWRVSAWRQAYRALPEARAALAAEQACGEGSKCYARLSELQAAQRAVSETVVAVYERELADLRSRPPAPAVRLCRPRGTGGVPGARPAGPADGAAPGGDVPVETSGDIGQRLFNLADQADREALKLRYLQEWNRALAAPQ